MKKFIVPLLITLMFVSLLSQVIAIEKIKPDPKAIDLLNKLLAALSIEDPDARLQAVIPLVHKSMLTADGKDLDSDTKQFSYKKAYQNVGCYKQPVEISQVHKGNTYTIGWEETAETGRTDKYFVKKKDGVNGMPAPIHVFWPENGGDPKIVNMGSL
jgi:hypothetical protein